MTCFVLSFSLPLALPFDWTFKILSMYLLFCFVCLSGCYVVMLCVKRNKKMLITKKKYAMGSDWSAGPVCCDWLNRL